MQKDSWNMTDNRSAHISHSGPPRSMLWSALQAISQYERSSIVYMWIFISFSAGITPTLPTARRCLARLTLTCKLLYILHVDRFFMRINFKWREKEKIRCHRFILLANKRVINTSHLEKWHRVVDVLVKPWGEKSNIMWYCKISLSEYRYMHGD